MSKCPKCGTAIPDEAHFCMHCFSSVHTDSETVTSLKGTSATRKFFISSAFKSILISVLAVSLIAAGGVVIKHFVIPKKRTATDNATLIPVTDSNGETVTNEDGSKIFQVVAAVTDSNGETVTDQNGEQVYDFSSYIYQEETYSTTKKGLLDFFFNIDKKTTEQSAKTSSSEPTASINDAINPTNPETSATSSTNQASTQTTSATVTEKTSSQTTTQTKINVSDFLYTEDNGIITITKYNGNDSYVTVPAYINGKPVKHVGEGAFSNNSKIKTIYFESGTHTFQFLYFTNVFYNLPNLKEIIFPKNTSAYALAPNNTEYHSLYFYKLIENCKSISGVYFGSKDNTVQGSLYSDNGVVYNNGKYLEYYPPAKTDSFYAITNPGCISIEGGAFKDNPYLKHLQIGKGINSINTGRDNKQFNFTGCTSLEKFSVAEGNNRFSVKDGVLFYRPDGTINGVIYYSFHYPPAKSDKYFKMIDQPVIENNSFHGNPYIETVQFVDKCYFTDVSDITGNVASPTGLKKMIFSEDPGWYYRSKLSDCGIKIEVIS